MPRRIHADTFALCLLLLEPTGHKSGNANLVPVSQDFFLCISQDHRPHGKRWGKLRITDLNDLGQDLYFKDVSLNRDTGGERQRWAGVSKAFLGFDESMQLLRVQIKVNIVIVLKVMLSQVHCDPVESEVAASLGFIDLMSFRRLYIGALWATLEAYLKAFAVELVQIAEDYLVRMSASAPIHTLNEVHPVHSSNSV